MKRPNSAPSQHNAYSYTTRRHAGHVCREGYFFPDPCTRGCWGCCQVWQHQAGGCTRLDYWVRYVRSVGWSRLRFIFYGSGLCRLYIYPRLHQQSLIGHPNELVDEREHVLESTCKIVNCPWKQHLCTDKFCGLGVCTAVSYLVGLSPLLPENRSGTGKQYCKPRTSWDSRLKQQSRVAFDFNRRGHVAGNTPYRKTLCLFVYHSLYRWRESR